ncbi:unnamed protein product [Clonostachys chloroleuca]|uniref:hydroxymethylglutaryl-CoA lyase n=1 Tax=Clonostachys chloroleuca TaxID=1926264 RepID=A0AA35QBZ4_9HYPO|nr:unnamed protein product [Clonostachys chloroleuca]
MGPKVTIVEVGPRDGLQNIKNQVPTEVKTELIRRLYDSGLRTIEVTSVVSPKAVPQLRDCHEVLRSKTIKQLAQAHSVRLPVLVPNIKGVKIAHGYGASEVAVFLSASEGFSRANINCTVDQGIARAREVTSEAKKLGMIVRGYVSCIFADPFDGPTPESAVLRVAKELLSMGCYQVSLGDTLGVGSPFDVRKLIQTLDKNGVPLRQLAGHFHDTYGQALANVWEAYQCGIRVFDSSVAGLGGCPFAPGATGNVATEDLVYMFNRAHVVTDVDLQKLVATGRWISSKLGIPSASRASAAISAKSQKAEASPPGHGINNRAIDLEWKEASKSEGLITHRSGASLRITMDRHRNGNALTTNMIEDLVSIFSSSANDPTISRIAIIGSGKFFCTGMDLGKSTTPVGTDETSANEQYERLHRLFETIDQSPKVTIACLNGPAFGGGVGLAFACDLRLATKDSSVMLSEARLGLSPATISKYVVREFGVPFAREAMLSARRIPAKELETRGIIKTVASDVAQLQSDLDKLVTELRFVSSDALKMCKELVRVSWSHGGQETQETVIKHIFEQMMKPDSAGSYGVKEFQAGRKVDWDLYQRGKAQSKL